MPMEHDPTLARDLTRSGRRRLLYSCPSVTCTRVCNRANPLLGPLLCGEITRVPLALFLRHVGLHMQSVYTPTLQLIRLSGRYGGTESRSAARPRLRMSSGGKVDFF